MAPEVLTRKLALLRRLLRDLEPYRDADLRTVEENHYEVERILELLGTAGADLMFHLLAEGGTAPDSYRDSFRRAGSEGVIPRDLAARLENAAGMRNVLVHLYEEIDLTMVHVAVGLALEDFARLVAAIEARLP